MNNNQAIAVAFIFIVIYFGISFVDVRYLNDAMEFWPKLAGTTFFTGILGFFVSRLG